MASIYANWILTGNETAAAVSAYEIWKYKLYGFYLAMQKEHQLQKRINCIEIISFLIHPRERVSCFIGCSTHAGCPQRYSVESC